MVLLMLLMCHPIILTRKDSILDREFFVGEVIFQLEARGFYAVSIIKKWRYYPNIVPGDSIGRNFFNKDGVGV